jgi:hypothetical protein
MPDVEFVCEDCSRGLHSSCVRAHREDWCLCSSLHHRMKRDRVDRRTHVNRFCYIMLAGTSTGYTKREVARLLWDHAKGMVSGR